MNDIEKKRFFVSFQRVKRSLPILFSSSELNFTELMALIHIKKSEEINVKLHESLHINKSAVSQMLSHLEKKGMITRKNNEKDRRKLDIEITDYGNKLLRENNQKRSIIADKTFNELGEEKSKILLEVFEEYSIIIDKITGEFNEGECTAK